MLRRHRSTTPAGVHPPTEGPVTTATRAPQLCRAHPDASPLGGTFQCHAERATRILLYPGGPTAPGTRPCGKAALWRITPRPGDEPSLDGWCTPHAANVLRARMRLQCGQRIPLAAARDAALRVVSDPDAGTEDPRDWAALRRANTALNSHDRSHSCSMP